MAATTPTRRAGSRRRRRRRAVNRATILEQLAEFDDAALVSRWHVIVEIVHRELSSLNLQRQLMQEATDVVNADPRFLTHPGRLLFDSFRDFYGTAMAVAVRRQNDSNRASASLRVLLDEMRARPGAYRIDALRPHMGVADDQIIRDFVMSAVCTEGTLDLDVRQLDSDLYELAKVSEVVRDHVNKHVAHTDLEAQRAPYPATFNDIHSAAEVCENITERWFAALVGMHRPVHVTAQYAWHDVFDFPWRSSRPNDDPGTRRFIVTIDPLLEGGERDAYFAGPDVVERTVRRLQEVDDLLRLVEKLPPHERRTGHVVFPDVVEVEHL